MNASKRPAKRRRLSTTAAAPPPSTPAAPPSGPHGSSPVASRATSGVAERATPYTATPATHFLYRAPLARFLADLAAQSLVPYLTQRFHAVFGFLPAQPEIGSWLASLGALGEALRDPAFAASEVFVEVRMPLCGRRCDVILTGTDVERRMSAVVVELKQWEIAGKSHVPEEVAIGVQSRQHPSAQVRDYVDFLRYYHSAFTGPEPRVALAGCAYLHAMTDARSLAHLRDPAVFGTLPRDYPLFAARERSLLVQYLAELLRYGAGADAAERIAAGRPLPSTKLLDVVAQAVQGEFEWRLLDEQRAVFVRIRTEVELARAESGRRTVVIVRGGPGTGKSVLAIQLLGHAAAKRWRVVHATGSQAFQTNLQGKTEAFADAKLKSVFGASRKKQLPVKQLFCTFANVASVTEKDTFDLVVADEAHRLWDYRRIKFPNGVVKRISDVPLAREMIRASRVTAFFLDENQAVRAGEVGTSALLREMAAAESARVVEFDLNLQFRCGGSESYVRWVDALLGFRADADLAWREFDGYDFRLVSDAPTLDALLRMHRAAGNRCRIVAGYCWRWNKPVNGRPPMDIDDPRFGGWCGAWIEKTGQGGKTLENQYYRWANEDAYYSQVGSIYSVQGFEFDYVGVILGEDMVWRTDRWVAQLDKNKDAVFKRDVRTAKGVKPVDMLRNVYRVLLTRGMKGTYLFVLDPETRAHVQRCLELPWALGAAAG